MNKNTKMTRFFLFIVLAIIVFSQGSLTFAENARNANNPIIKYELSVKDRPKEIGETINDYGDKVLDFMRTMPGILIALIASSIAILGFLVLILMVVEKIYNHLAVPYEGKILKKQYVPANIKRGTRLRRVGEVTVPMMYVDEIEQVFKLLVRGRTRLLGERECWIEVAEEYYKAVSVGDEYGTEMGREDME